MNHNKHGAAAKVCKHTAERISESFDKKMKFRTMIAKASRYEATFNNSGRREGSK